MLVERRILCNTMGLAHQFPHFNFEIAEFRVLAELRCQFRCKSLQEPFSVHNSKWKGAQQNGPK